MKLIFLSIVTTFTLSGCFVWIDKTAEEDSNQGYTEFESNSTDTESTTTQTDDQDETETTTDTVTESETETSTETATETLTESETEKRMCVGWVAISLCTD